jgi:hypothetical protein
MSRRQNPKKRFFASLIGPWGGAVSKSGLDQVRTTLRHEGAGPHLEVLGILLDGVPHVVITAEQGLVSRVLYSGPLEDILDEPGSECCACPSCDEDRGVGREGPPEGHLFCGPCAAAGCSEDLARCCSCSGKGWDVFNAEPEAGELGDVQRCDECQILPGDDVARERAMEAGYVIDAENYVRHNPPASPHRHI